MALQLGRFEGSEEVKSRSAPEQVPAAGTKACSFVATMKKKKAILWSSRAMGSAAIFSIKNQKFSWPSV